MDKTKSFILDGLSYYALADLPGRPYDCALSFYLHLHLENV